MPVSMTDRADFTFVAKEYHRRTPWIAAEQLAGDKLVLPGLIGFDLAPGTTFEQAKEIADYMRKHIHDLTDCHCSFPHMELMEGNYARALAGATDDPYLLGFGDGVVELAERALAFTRE